LSISDNFCPIDNWLECLSLVTPNIPSAPEVPACVWSFILCFVTPPAQTGKVFGFAEFVQAFALLVVVYTVADVRYRFRIRSAPLPLWLLTFVACGLIGLGTLMADFWYSNKFPVPTFLTEQTTFSFPSARYSCSPSWCGCGSRSFDRRASVVATASATHAPCIRTSCAARTTNFPWSPPN
jgi:hypothetical protein